MKITITSPEQLRSERQQLMAEAIKLLKQYGRSCERYAMKIRCINNKIVKIERQLGE